MNKTSPFPGMDPFLEAHWYDVHTRLIVILSNQIAATLPDDLRVQVEKSLTVSDEEEEDSRYRSDVAVTGPKQEPEWKTGWSPDEDSSEGGTAVAAPAAVATPVVIKFPRPSPRHLEIRMTGEHRRLVTTIEVLSPGNKLPGFPRERYAMKRERLLYTDANFVEIDLIRAAPPFLPGGFTAEHDPTPYLVTVHRAFEHDLELYPIGIEEPLPTFLVPLRPRDRDIAVNLQAAIGDCYRDGQYWKTVEYRADALRPEPGDELRGQIDGLLAGRA